MSLAENIYQHIRNLSVQAAREALDFIELLEKLHKLLVLGWRQKISTRARVKIEIENALDEGLPRAYSKEVYEAKCSAVFEHVYQSYQGEGQSVYAA